MKKFVRVTFDEVVSVENLCEAWQEFIRGKRKKKDVQEFTLHLGDEIVNLHLDLMNEAYRHGSYSHFRINDPKPREIHKATVRDRLLHHAIHRKLYPWFARTFISDSFSCQIGKGLHRAIERFCAMARKVSQNGMRTCWILKCDIRKFFASINHEILISILRRRIVNRRLIALIADIVGSFNSTPGRGIPLGNLTSQLFANVYMNELDQFVKHDLRARHYIRYADDFIFLSRDRNELLRFLPEIAAFLLGSLNLRLHPDKVFMKTLTSGMDFLGWVHFPKYRALRTKVKRRMFKGIRKQPSNERLQSYLGLIKHGSAHEIRTRVLNDYWLWSGDHS